MVINFIKLNITELDSLVCDVSLAIKDTFVLVGIIFDWSICRYSTNVQKGKLSSMMWKIWPCLPDYGRRAAQFVDLLGYFTMKSESSTDEVRVGISVVSLANISLCYCKLVSRRRGKKKW